MDPQNPIQQPAEPLATPVEPAVPAEPAVPDVPAADPAQVQKDREQALQDALDAALEVLSKPAAPVTPEAPEAPEVPAAPVEPAVPVKPVVPDVPSAPIEPQKPADNLTQQFTRIMEKLETYDKRFGEMELRAEMIAMTDELRAAIIKFPHADEKAILLSVEAGSEKSVTELAQESHDKYTQLVSNIEKETEEKLREKILKENEGKISVPQSAGTSSTPADQPQVPGMPSFNRTNDDEWATALSASKANLGK